MRSRRSALVLAGILAVVGACGKGRELSSKLRSLLQTQTASAGVTAPPMTPRPNSGRWASGAGGLPGELWQSRGVGGGGALFVPEISPFDDQLYMATDMGAVFRSQNLGQSWGTLNFRRIGGGAHAQIRFTADPRRLYAIGVRATPALLVSRDGGETFAPALGAQGVEAMYLEVDPASSDRLVVSDYGTLRFSGDGGQSVRTIQKASDSGTGIIVGGSFWDGQDIYIGTNEGLVVSHNGGSSFGTMPCPGIPANEAILSFAGAKVGAKWRFFAVTTSKPGTWAGISSCEAAGAYRGVYRLDSDESSWTNVSLGVPSGHRPAFVRMAVNDIDVAYLAGSRADPQHPAVSKTIDGGRSWTDVFRTRSNANIRTGWSGSGGDASWTFGECAEGFAVSTSDSKRAVLTDMGFVHGTTDGASSWWQLYVDPADENPAAAPTPHGKAYRTSGVEQTSGWWLTWADDHTLFGSLTDITSVRSTNGGIAWARESDNGLRDNTTYQTLVHPSGALYAATSSIHDLYMSYRLADAQLDGGKGSVMRSSNKGATWTTVHAFGHPVVSLAFDPGNTESMYATVEHSREGGVFRTVDLSKGAESTWTRLAQPPRTEGHPYILNVLRDATVVVTYSGRRDSRGAFTDSSGVFVSVDHGDTWEDRSDPNMHYWTKDLVVDPGDPTESTWYVGVFRPFGAGVPPIHNGLFRTTDRGRHWTLLWEGHNVESCTRDPRNPQRLFVTTESDGLFVTNALGAPMPLFVPDPDYPFAHPMRVFFNPKDPAEAWVVSFGGGFRVRRL